MPEGASIKHKSPYMNIASRIEAVTGKVSAFRSNSHLLTVTPSKKNHEKLKKIRERRNLEQIIADNGGIVKRNNASALDASSESLVTNITHVKSTSTRRDERG